MNNNKKKNPYHDSPEVIVGSGSFWKNLDLSVVVEAEHTHVLRIVLDERPTHAKQS